MVSPGKGEGGSHISDVRASKLNSNLLLPRQ